jgi:hypothetical protein
MLNWVLTFVFKVKDTCGNGIISLGGWLTWIRGGRGEEAKDVHAARTAIFGSVTV